MAEADPAGADKARPETDSANAASGGEVKPGANAAHDDAHDDAAWNDAESPVGESASESADESAGDAKGDAKNDSVDTADESPQAQDPASLSPQELLARLSEADAENAQAKDGLLRAKAEAENIRRRAQNEIVAARKYAIEGFAQELLVVKDSLDQAAAVEIDHDAGDALPQMKEGINLTRKQLDIALAKFAVVEVEAAPGTRFDPERHQAISMTPSGEIAADHIIAVVQKGFTLKERLLRPAMVVVASGATPEAAAETASEAQAQ